MQYMIKASYRGKEYELPAFETTEKKGDVEVKTGYITPYCKGVEIAFCDILRNFPDVSYEQKEVYLDNSRSIAAVRIIAQDVNYGWSYGEVTKGVLGNEMLTEAERSHPFQCALNRAFVNAVMRLFGFYSKTFTKDGKPIYYDFEKVTFSEEDKAELETLSKIELNINNKIITLSNASEKQLQFFINLDTNAQPAYKMLQDNVKRFVELKEKEKSYVS